MTQLLTVVAEMRAKPGKENALRQVVLELIEPTQAEPGCLQYDLHEHVSEPGHFVFYEKWTDEEALTKHLSSAHLTAFKASWPELLDGAPVVERYRRIA